MTAVGYACLLMLQKNEVLTFGNININELLRQALKYCVK